MNAVSPQRAHADRGRIVASMLALYFIWGSTFLAIRLALPGFPPLMMSGLRFVCAGGIFYLVLRLRGEPRPSRVQWFAAFRAGPLLGSGTPLVLAPEARRRCAVAG